MNYEELLEKARETYESEDTPHVVKAWLLANIIYPADESEDEKMRKMCIRYLDWEYQHCYCNEDKTKIEKCIAWLEKQGTKEVDPRYKYLEDLLTADDIHQMSMNEAMVEEAKSKAVNALSKLGISKLLGLKKQGEQTHAELGQSEVTKASDQEPKFSVGDWITDGYVGGQITSIEENYPCYKIVDFMGINTSIPFTIQDNYHLWTIQDAKDGDVLAYVTDEEDLWIMIYRSLYEPYEGHVHYHALLVNDNFSDKGTCCICIDNLIPATKEQRDLLFQKMKEAAYEWDSDKKKLKKIEVASKESEDEKIGKEILQYIKSYAKLREEKIPTEWFEYLEKQDQQKQDKKLDADEVIEWLNHRELMSDEFINRFKKYFGL